MNLLGRKGVVEDCQLVEIAVPHIEISFFGRRAKEVQLRANCEGANSWISMELPVRLRVNFDAISIKTQQATIGDKRDMMPGIERQWDLIPNGNLSATAVDNMGFELTAIFV